MQLGLFNFSFRIITRLTSYFLPTKPVVEEFIDPQLVRMREENHIWH